MTEPLAHPLSGPLPLHLDSALSSLPVSILLGILASEKYTSQYTLFISPRTSLPLLTLNYFILVSSVIFTLAAITSQRPPTWGSVRIALLSAPHG